MPDDAARELVAGIVAEHGQEAFLAEGYAASDDLVIGIADLIRRERQELLAHVYPYARLAVARLCDDVLDPSGRLLGTVRHLAGVARRAAVEGDTAETEEQP